MTAGSPERPGGEHFHIRIQGDRSSHLDINASSFCCQCIIPTKTGKANEHKCSTEEIEWFVRYPEHDTHTIELIRLAEPPLAPIEQPRPFMSSLLLLCDFLKQLAST